LIFEYIPLGNRRGQKIGAPTRRFVKAFPLMVEAWPSGAMAFGLFVAKKP
jgi:hypothetical protein